MSTDLWNRKQTGPCHPVIKRDDLPLVIRQSFVALCTRQGAVRLYKRETGKGMASNRDMGITHNEKVYNRCYLQFRHGPMLEGATACTL